LRILFDPKGAPVRIAGGVIHLLAKPRGRVQSLNQTELQVKGDPHTKIEQAQRGAIRSVQPSAEERPGCPAQSRA
jgi:hypothetical protein